MIFKNKPITIFALVIFSAIFGIIGYKVLKPSFAATPFAGPGTTGFDANIPGMHTPATLSVVNSGMASSSDGQVIEGKDIKGALSIGHKNVIVRNSRMRILNVSPSASVTCEWCTIGDPNGIRQNDPQLGATPYNAVGMYNYKIYRSNIFGTVDIFKLRAGYAEVRESWMHDAIEWSQDPAQHKADGSLDTSHTDFFQTALNGDVSDIKLIDNYWDAWVFGENQKAGDTYRNLSTSKTATGIVTLLQQGTNFRVLNAEIRGNVFNGDAYFIMYDLNNNLGQPVQNLKFVSNTIYQNYPTYGVHNVVSANTPSSITWGCNVNEKKGAVNYSGTTPTTNCTLPGATEPAPAPPPLPAPAPDFNATGLSNNSTISGGLTVQTTPVNVTTPEFSYYLDNNLINTEKNAPFCFSSELQAVCQAYDTKQLTNAAHVMKISMKHSTGQIDKTFNFTVSNTSPTPPPDTTPPSVPSGVSATAAAYNKVNVSWSASTDKVGVTGYTVWRGSTAIANVAAASSLAYSDTTVSAKTSYSYTITAKDAAGNVSAQSNAGNVTTPSAPDTVAPSVPTGLSAKAVSPSQINLSWTPGTDNVAVAGYEVWRANGTKLATISSTSYGATGLSAATAYNFYVKALDAAGNVSANSITVTATTQALPTPLPSTRPGNLVGTLSSSSGDRLRKPHISLVYGGSTHTYAPNSSGQYSLSGIPIGTYSVNYSAQRYQSQTISVTITSNATTTKDVELERR